MEPEVAFDVRSVLEMYAEEINRCRYGSFRGVIKDGKVVVFTIEHEWRPQLEVMRRQGTAEPD